MRYHIITYGCQMNKSDSERIAAVLEKRGYQKALKKEKADLIVVNMCSVRQSAVDRVYGKLNQISKIKNQNDKVKCKIILTGCILPKDRKKLKNQVDFVLDIKNLPNWPKILKNFKSKNLKSLPWQLFQVNTCSYLDIQPKYQYKPVAFVPISNGCNNFCTYCVVPFTRGPLVCRPAEEILSEVRGLVQKGFKEIWLLGQNVNDYQSEIQNPKSKIPKQSLWDATEQTNSKFKIQNSKQINFAKLLKMVNDLPGDFKFFFTSPHPKNFSDELIEVLANCQKFGKYLNLPVQSGDNEILKKMNRPYTVEQYKNLVKKIREKIPDINLSTDVIVGFPGETKKQFENTVKLFKEIKFDRAYIAKYSPRPGTAAFQLKDNVPLEEKKRREKLLREILKHKTQCLIRSFPIL